MPRRYTAPPLGFYDPTLDANLGAANRGLADLQQDTETQRGRLTSDYITGVNDIQTGYGRQLADVETQRGYGEQDHASQLAELQRVYSQRASGQRQQINQMGLLGGGAALQAAQKRAANQAHDQAPIDTGFQRLISGLATTKQRLGEDQTNAFGKLALQMAPPDAGNPFGGRAFQDLTTMLTRGERENTAFGLDTTAAKVAQATAAGWDPYALMRRKKKIR